jgi:hypothetical protein
MYMVLRVQKKQIRKKIVRSIIVIQRAVYQKTHFNTVKQRIDTAKYRGTSSEARAGTAG